MSRTLLKGEINMSLEIGDSVTALYKTGKYIGEITQVRDQHYVVRVKAVIKHPQQGDLHNPQQGDVPFFHERRALAFNEQANIPKPMVKAYTSEIPSYRDSLKTALTSLINELSLKDNPYATRSIECLEQLQKDYAL